MIVADADKVGGPEVAAEDVLWVPLEREPAQLGVPPPHGHSDAGSQCVSILRKL